MEENEVKTNEVVEETSTGATGTTENKVVTDFNQIQDDINEIKDEKEKSMDEVLNTAKDKVKEAEDKVLEDFLAEQEPPVKSYDELTDEQKEEYEKYKESKLPSMIEAVYANAKNKVFEVSKERLDALKSKEEEAKEFEGTLDGEIKDREAQIEKLDPEKDADEIARLQNEIAEIQEIQGNFDKKIYGVINKATAYQKTINTNAINSLEETFKPYPSIDVKGDPDLANINKQLEEKAKDEAEITDDDLEKDEKEEIEEEQVEEEQKGEDGQVQQQAQQVKGGQQIDPATLAKAMQAAQAAGAGSGATAAAPAQEEVEETVQSLSDMLGINPNNALGFDSSWALLANFASPALTDAKRLEMLNDPECKNYIMSAMRIAGSSKNPFKTNKYKGLRDQVLELAKGPMMEMALRQYGVEFPENVEKSFEELKQKYVDERAALGDEDKEAIEALNEKYDTMFNVEDFQMSSDKLKTLRTRMKDFFSNFSAKDKVKKLSEKIDDKMFVEAKDQAEEEIDEKEPEKEEQTLDAQEQNIPGQMSLDDMDRENGTNFMAGVGVKREMTVEQAKKELGEDAKVEDKDAKKIEDDLVK